MKGTLWCKIFGHKFARTAEFFGNPDGYSSTERYDWCHRCGLTKEELGLTHHKDAV